MSKENSENSLNTEETCCKEHAVVEDVKPSSTLSTSNQREYDGKEHYLLTKETRDATDEDQKVCYIISREDSIVKEALELADADLPTNSEYGYDEYCEVHAQEMNASTQDTFDIIDECFSFATDIVSTAVDNCPDFNIFPYIIELCLKTIIYLKTNPKFTSVIVSLLVLWWVWCQIDSYYSFLIAHIVHSLNPCVHYLAITSEQIFRRGFQLSASLQEVWESFYCDFSIKWCRKFELMCDVQCSHVHRTLERMRRIF
ncbi:unnamed protein product [Auanema sp. JU1783]|nr:unnamed protein product [Auanema sp. JU1783]